MRTLLRTLSWGLTLGFLFILCSSPGARGQAEFLCTEVTAIPLAECQALVVLYDSTNGAGWVDNTNWLVDPNPDEWFGVTVESGVVTNLVLKENGLSGFIPPDLGTLSSLVHLDLSSNQLSGEIPLTLGSLTNLTQLDLGGNQLTGDIPTELGNLSVLAHLYLNSNQLSGEIPSQLGNLTKLERLYLYDNSLTGPIPTSLGNLTLMWNLWLSGNQLSGPIPVGLGQLSGLVFLRLAGNQLSGEIPPELSALTALWQLSLGNNQLTGEIPPALSGMSALLYLSLAGNQLTGSIPSQLGLLTNLYELDISSNQLSGSIPSELGDLQNLGILWLNQNDLSGDIPTSLSNLIYLELPGTVDGSDGLNLDYNALTVPENYPDPDSPLQQFLSQFDPNWHTLQAFEQVIGVAGGVFTALDSRTTFFVPAGALSGDTTFTFTPLPVPAYDPGALVDANHSFQMTAENASGLPVTTFSLPLTVTLTYTDTDVLELSEDSLALFYWDTSVPAWQDAVATCLDGAYTRDLLANSLILPLCHLSDFSAFGLPLQQTFLPLIVRRAGG